MRNLNDNTSFLDIVMISPVTAHVGVLVLYLISPLPHCDGYIHKVYDRLRWKMLDMDRELLVDAITKVEAVQYLRARFSKTMVYHIGELVYMVRSKYALMLRIYFRCVREEENYSHHRLIRELARLKKLASDIYHCAAALDELTRTAFYKESLSEGVPTRRQSGGSLRKSLAAAEATLREEQARRREALAAGYPPASTHVPDVFQKLKQATHNWTDLIGNKTAARHLLYGPSSELTLIY